MSDPVNHPPIPPNCEFFLSKDDIVRKIPKCFTPKVFPNSIFFMIEVTRFIDLANDYIPWNWRKVISSVARCAWEDESEECCRFHAPTMENPHSKKPLTQEGLQALRNAEAWQEWGKQ